MMDRLLQALRTLGGDDEAAFVQAVQRAAIALRRSGAEQDDNEESDLLSPSRQAALLQAAERVQLISAQLASLQEQQRLLWNSGKRREAADAEQSIEELEAQLTAAEDASRLYEHDRSRHYRLLLLLSSALALIYDGGSVDGWLREATVQVVAVSCTLMQAEYRRLALLAMGRLCLLKEDMARERLHIFMQVLPELEAERDERRQQRQAEAEGEGGAQDDEAGGSEPLVEDDSVLLVAIRCLSDLLVHHLSLMSAVPQPDRLALRLFAFIRSFPDSEETDGALYLAAMESLCRLLLARRLQPCAAALLACLAQHTLDLRLSTSASLSVSALHAQAVQTFLAFYPLYLQYQDAEHQSARDALDAMLTLLQRIAYGGEQQCFHSLNRTAVTFLTPVLALARQQDSTGAREVEGLMTEAALLYLRAFPLSRLVKGLAPVLEMLRPRRGETGWWLRLLQELTEEGGTGGVQDKVARRALLKVSAGWSELQQQEAEEEGREAELEQRRDERVAELRELDEEMGGMERENEEAVSGRQGAAARSGARGRRPERWREEEEEEDEVEEVAEEEEAEDEQEPEEKKAPRRRVRDAEEAEDDAEEQRQRPAATTAAAPRANGRPVRQSRSVAERRQLEEKEKRREQDRLMRDMEREEELEPDSLLEEEDGEEQEEEEELSADDSSSDAESDISAKENRQQLANTDQQLVSLPGKDKGR